MNRLYIISNTLEHGSSLANMTLGLSEGQFKVITSIKQINEVPSNIIFIHDQNHPVDSIMISDHMKALGGLNMKDNNYLNEFIYRLYQDVQTVNSMYDPYRDRTGTSMGCNALVTKFNYRGLNENNGFEYQILRNQQHGYFYFKPESPRMEVVYNLYLGYVNNVIKPSMTVEGFKVGKPIMSL